MPPTQRGQAYKLSSGKWGLRYYDGEGNRQRKSPFASKSAALTHFRDVIEPRLRGDAPPAPDLTLAPFIALWLDRHAATVRPRTISTLRERLGHAERAFGTIPLHDLAGMAAEIAAWRALQPERVRYARLGALRQCLEAAVRWGYLLATRQSSPAATDSRRPDPSASIHASSSTRSPSSSPPPTPRCLPSPPRPAFAPRSGPPWSVATSTGARAP